MTQIILEADKINSINNEDWITDKREFLRQQGEIISFYERFLKDKRNWGFTLTLL